MAKPIETLSPTDEAIFRTATLKSLQGAAEDPNRIGAEYMPSNSVLLNPSASVIVDAEGSDTDRGTALVAAYAAAKLLTPNGAALSASNRAQVIIPIGKYKLSDTLVLDTNFVDLIALIPGRGGDLQDTDDEIENTINSLDNFRPPATLIYSEFASKTTVRQTASNVRTIGFGIASLNAVEWVTIFELSQVFVFEQGDIACDDSYYGQMYYWSRYFSNGSCGTVGAYSDFSGTWVDCIGNSLSFVVGKGTWNAELTATDSPNGQFRAKMYDCQGGPYSFIGDGVETGACQAVGAQFFRCRVVGLLSSTNAGGFGACGFLGTAIDADCYFEDCSSGNNSYAIGRNCAGTFVRCRSGSASFGAGGTFSGLAIDCQGGDGSFAGNGVFSGEAIRCQGGAGSFGSRYVPNISWSEQGDAAYCSGILDNCQSEGSPLPRNLAGARIRNSRLTTTTTGEDGVKLLDSNSVISNSDLIVVQGGTGIPINAASARNVSAYGCRMNNASNDADGLGSNVTNLVTGGAGNVVSNAVK
jgi:hypothetical protein